jgi:acetyltransferase-like isoleucine patch superfamily enzyme
MTIPELHGRIRFWRTADRIGPDIPWTHWRLHFKSLMTALCRSKLAAFGEGAEIRPGAYVVLCSRVSLGRRVVIRPGTMLHASPDVNVPTIIIEDDVMLGSGVQIYVDKHRFDDVTMPIIDQGEHPAEAVRLARGCWIGANAIILPGVTVGENAVVGAGSIVTRDVPARTLVAGSPARVIRAIGNSSTS